MDFTTIRHELDDGILTVVLDRPDNLNAFTVEMADGVGAHLRGGQRRRRGACRRRDRRRPGVLRRHGPLE